jgi:hypothetical protein
MKKVATVLAVCLFALCLSACAIFNADLGPCYGHGCPAIAPKNAPPAATAASGADPNPIASVSPAERGPDGLAKEGEPSKSSPASDPQAKHGE